MKHILFDDNPAVAEVAILIKGRALYADKLRDHYITPLGVDQKYFIGFDLYYPEDKKKPSAAQMKDYISVLMPEIDKLGIKHILCADAEYFKKLTKKTKAEPYYGELVDCAIEGYEHMKIQLTVNYQAMHYNPDVQKKLNLSVNVFKTAIQGSYQALGENIIQHAEYPMTVKEIRRALADLHTRPALTADIEGRSLEFWNCGIASIGFAWNEHEGVAFPVDRSEDPAAVRAMLKDFFDSYGGKLTWHNSGFDLKVIIYTLWMQNLGDYKGMLEGLHIMTKNFHDSMLIAYLATNNTVKNTLGLKDLAFEFAGNYAEEMTGGSDPIPLDRLLEYNLKDCLATAFVLNKYGPIMVMDEQQDLYTDLFLPSVKTLLQTELCGIPISPSKVQDAKRQLQALVDKYTKIILDNKEVQEYHFQAQEKLRDELTAKAKKKVYELDDPIVQRFVFNPGSDTQLRGLLYEYLGYPIIDLTKKGKQASTSADTLKKLKANAKSVDHEKLLDAIVKLGEASIILSTFIPAFERAQQLPNGEWRLYGNFKLGGTISLRLSSSNPNLMNLPSGSVFGKMIKACFISTKKWVFVGSDFDALEDKVNALQTRDPNKMKIYEEGFCGHCLRAYNYWPNQFPDIDPNDVNSINSIKVKYKALRGKSKAPSFALQYKGTYITLMNNCGFSKQEAKTIEKNYQEMYKVAIEWADNHIHNARATGYVPLAFGGRLRTPVLLAAKKMTYKAQSEARSAGNALTQSYCILTLRAFNEFMERVWESPYAEKILPSITIHDAIYLVVRNSVKIMKWINDNLIECMAWNDLDELQHPVIKISSALDVHFQDWRYEVGIPNGATAEEIRAICRGYKRKFDVKNWCGVVTI